MKGHYPCLFLKIAFSFVFNVEGESCQQAAVKCSTKKKILLCKAIHFGKT